MRRRWFVNTPIGQAIILHLAVAIVRSRRPATKAQAPSDIMRVNVSADSSSATIDGLDERRDYTVKVYANTRAGSGEASCLKIEKSFR